MGLRVAFILAAALGSACSSASKTAPTGPDQSPVIDAVSSPQTLAMASDGTWLWQPTVTYHDPDGDAVTKYHLTLKDVVDTSAFVNGNGGTTVIEISVHVPKGTAPGAHAFTISLTDATGAESAVYDGMITLL